MYCDTDFKSSDWIRFKSNNVTDNMITDKCMPMVSCQTLSAGWINGSHPAGYLP